MRFARNNINNLYIPKELIKWIRSEADTTGNQVMANKLEGLGYIINSDNQGYNVFHRERFISGAGTITKQTKNWQHGVTDRRIHFFHAVCVAYDDAVGNGILS